MCSVQRSLGCLYFFFFLVFSIVCFNSMTPKKVEKEREGGSSSDIPHLSEYLPPPPPAFPERLVCDIREGYALYACPFELFCFSAACVCMCVVFSVCVCVFR